LSKPAYDPETIAQDFEYIATKLGITVEELQGYMDALIRLTRIINRRIVFIR
jgi:hypothetical protein